MSSYKGKQSKKLPTVFDGDKAHTSYIQHEFLKENLDVLVENYKETKSDFVMIVPESKNNKTQSKVIFMSLTDEIFNEVDPLINRLKNYVLTNYAIDKIVIVFYNGIGYFSYYTVSVTQR